jgi:hypothetical protein
VANGFIHLADQLSDDWALPTLSAASIYGATRFNALHATHTTNSPEERATAARFL